MTVCPGYPLDHQNYKGHDIYMPDDTTEYWTVYRRGSTKPEDLVIADGEDLVDCYRRINQLVDGK